MTWDDINENTVRGFIVRDAEEFKAFCDGLTPAVLRQKSERVTAFMGIEVRVNSALPPNKIAICDDSGIIGFFDMTPEP